jgi:hypothetical protein
LASRPFGAGAHLPGDVLHRREPDVDCGIIRILCGNNFMIQ